MKSLGIKTIGDLASHPMVRAASSVVDAGNVVLLDEMVSTYRVSQRTNFRPITLAALAAPESEGNDLFSMIQASKDAPGTTSIAVVDTSGPAAPSGKPTQDALEIYNDMLTLSSLANVVAMQGVFKEDPTKYNITDPATASAFTQAQVVNLNDTFTRRLGTYALPGETTSQLYSKDVTSAALHLDFLSTLFQSFNFNPAAVAKLDGILTQVTDSLKNLNLSMESETQTLDHLIFTNYLEAMDIPGGSEKVLVGKIRLFYIKISQTSWKAVVAKQTIAHFDFTMNYFDTIFTINSNLLRGDIGHIQKLIQQFTNQSFDEVSKLTSPTVISK